MSNLRENRNHDSYEAGNRRRPSSASRVIRRLGGFLALAAAVSLTSGPAVAGSCQLKSAKGDIQHVIYMIFDNVHFLRDNPRVPSDLEQMPNLLNFIRKNGTLMTNDHTVLISHTANGILTDLTGVYSDRHGQPVANSYRWFNVNGNGTTGSSSSFKYWTDSVDGGNPATSPATPSGDTNYNMIADEISPVTGKPMNMPAPWVAYTRAGCDFGAAGGPANIVLENNNAVVFAAGPTTLASNASAGDTNVKVTSTSGFKVGMLITIDTGTGLETATIKTVGTSGSGGTGLELQAALGKAHLSAITPVYGPTATDTEGDMTRVFGEGTPEWNEGKTSQIAPAGSAQRNRAQTDFVGFAIHCAKTADSICAGNANARPDLLPDEPGGYVGYQGLFGAKYVNPAITGGSTFVNKLNGQPITDQFMQNGFPGFDGLFATTTLAYIAQMQEAGIPVTFGYISDAHDQHGIAGEIHATRGPGEADYVQQLQDYDTAFGQFFARLAAAGIDESNTLFVFTVEEGDHFVGSQPTPKNCDGVRTPCTYSLRGEINGNLAGLLNTQQGIATSFTVHSDMAPTIYIAGNPGPANPVTRNFGRALGMLTAVSPYTGNTDVLGAALADPVGMKALHMVTADPLRTPTLVMFAHPDYFFFAAAANCNSPCITVPTTPPTSTFAWNHGGIQPEIATTWLGIAGPGVHKHGDDKTWADHTDTRPTMLALLGLEDMYDHDGRVLIDQLEHWAVPKSLVQHRGTVQKLGEVYKQLNAPFGQFGTDALVISTRAIKSGSAADDSTYVALSQQLSELTTNRDAVAISMRTMLEAAAFDGQEIDDKQATALIKQGEALLKQIHDATKQ